MTPVFVDLETQSTVDLPARGGRAYAADPSTRVLTLVALIDGVYHLWIPDWVRANLPAAFKVPFGGLVLHRGVELPMPVQKAVHDGRIFAAHNAFTFDKLVWEAKLTPVPRHWHDTLPDCRAAGLPGKLDHLGKVLLGRGKDDAGNRALHKLTTAEERNGKVIYPAPLAKYIEQAAFYNCIDVEILAKVWEVCGGAAEPDVLAVDRTVNDRGIAFDMLLGERLGNLSSLATDRAAEDITRLTGGRLHKGNLRKAGEVHAWLREHGAVLFKVADDGTKKPCLDKKTVDRFCDAPEDFADDETAALPSIDQVVFDVLRLRSSYMRITGAKLEAATNSISPDGRIRDLFVYWGAHTGRWAGRRLQLQNLTKGLDDLDVEALLGNGPPAWDDILQAAEHLGKLPDAVLSSLIRPCVVAAPGHILLDLDFAGIEARGLAWAAGETETLEMFRLGGDPYCRLATRIYGREITKADKAERQVGKVAELGAGYQLGHNKFAAFAAGCRIDLAAAGVTAEQVVEAYRSAHPKIAGVISGRWNDRPVRKGGLWNNYADAVKRAMDGEKTTAGRCGFQVVDGHLEVTLPSGRVLTYRNIRWEDVSPAWGGDPRPTITYDSPRGHPAYLYGGKITENLVQAICRDLLARALVLVERAGLRPVAHVHDSIVCEVARWEYARELSQMAEIMSSVPRWAEGFPIKVEGHASLRYYKAAPMDAWTIVAEDGKVTKLARRSA